MFVSSPLLAKWHSPVRVRILLPKDVAFTVI